MIQENIILIFLIIKIIYFKFTKLCWWSRQSNFYFRQKFLNSVSMNRIVHIFFLLLFFCFFFIKICKKWKNRMRFIYNPVNMSLMLALHQRSESTQKWTGSRWPNNSMLNWIVGSQVFFFFQQTCIYKFFFFVFFRFFSSWILAHWSILPTCLWVDQFSS